MVASVRFVGMMLGLLLKVSFLWLVANAHFLSVVPVTNMREKMALNAVLSAGKDTCATEVSQSALLTSPPFSFFSLSHKIVACKIHKISFPQKTHTQSCLTEMIFFFWFCLFVKLFASFVLKSVQIFFVWS